MSVCVYGFWGGGEEGLLSCCSLQSRWSARAGGAGWGGGRERREGGSWQQMAQAGLGLSDKRVGGGWPSAPGGSLRPPPTPGAEKRTGGMGGSLLLGLKFHPPPCPPQTHREDATREKAAGAGVSKAKVRAPSTKHHPLLFHGPHLWGTRGRGEGLPL